MTVLDVYLVALDSVFQPKSTEQSNSREGELFCILHTLHREPFRRFSGAGGAVRRATVAQRDGAGAGRTEI